MAADRNPSGLPGNRIVGPIWGPAEHDVDRRVGLQHTGLVRVRRTLLITSGVVAAIVVLVAVSGGTDSAVGIAAILLTPLLFVLAVLQVLVMLTRPGEPTGHPDDS